MEKAIQELIKKREDMLGGIGPIGSSWDYIEDFITDLKTLQPERDEVEIKKLIEMTKTEKLEITKEIDRIVHKYPRPDSSELFRSELEYLVKVVIKSFQEPTEEREDICLRCGVEHKEVKREGSSGCSSRGFHYPKHIWK